MKVQLFIPCYVDQLYPHVGIATYELLVKLGCEVIYLTNQTCCGQPMSNSGFDHVTSACSKNFMDCFSSEYPIVCPSGSCALHIKDHLHGTDKGEAYALRANVFELTEFLVDTMHVEINHAYFPFKVGFHNSCHGQRGLHISSMSELVLESFSKPLDLLKSIEGIELCLPSRSDECCGFGGTFCVTEEAVSVKMGKDRLQEHLDNGVQVITGNDMSCLMHLEGLIKRNHYPVRVLHIAEILNQSLTHG